MNSTDLSAKIPAAQHHNRLVYAKNRSDKPVVKNCLAGFRNVAKKQHDNLTFTTDVPILLISGVTQISESVSHLTWTLST